MNKVGTWEKVQVTHRASQINALYINKARKADREYNEFDNSGAAKGPVQSKLEEYGVVKALIFGPRGEASDDVHELLKTLAQAAAEKSWRGMESRNVKEAKAVFKDRMIMVIGIAAVRESAKHKRRSFGVVIGDGKTAAEVRAASRAENMKMQEEYEAYAGRGYY